MKMAKPSERDIDAAGELLSLMNDLSSGYCPWDGDDDATYFDPDDRQHLRRLYDVLDGLLDRAPGFTNRVIGGMCYVICWDQNEILDPAEDFIALHPDLRAGLRLLQAQRADFMPRLERAARAAVANTIEAAATRHLEEMRECWREPSPPPEPAESGIFYA
ncbi:hypothetical protein [Delftia tsuruhatensis]|uniref:hypothetical protein n=1 Tax=Delftia tsuruhatensis TaxID=180282 RepID=UPI002AD57366|nr:hypothetical protein [Delftia tsuruhatensis]WQM81743.1 hypothetical protein RNT40_23995 [Delftia tsuruhatensis]